MFDSLFPSHWSDLQKLMWLKILKGGTASYETITGNPVTFTAKAAPLKQLQIAFSPVQDLHGYDAPWPAGGGANKFNPSAWIALGTNTQYYSVSGETITVIANDNAGIGQRLFDVEAGETYSVFYDGGFSSMRVFDSTAETLISGNSKTFTAPENGKIAVKFFATSYPASGRVILVKGSTIPTAWTPYSNECPISGWDGVTVWRTGKNLFDKTSVVSAYIDSSNKIIYANEFKSIYVQLKPNVTYTLSQTVVSAWANRAALANSLSANEPTYNPITKAGGKINNSAAYTLTFTNTDFKYLIVSNYRETADGNNFDAIEDSCQFELGATATEYVPYNPSSRSISISFGSTVYSGTMDVLTGVVTVTIGYVVYDGSLDENWTRHTQGTASAFAMSVPVDGATAIGLEAKLKANYLKTLASNAPWGSNDCWISMNNNVSFKTGIKSITTVEAWREYLAEHPLTVAFPLATPLTIQLTPQQVSSLAGENVMWSDANGDLTVEYRSN